jgi:hypothetical protein
MMPTPVVKEVVEGPRQLPAVRVEPVLGGEGDRRGDSDGPVAQQWGHQHGGERGDRKAVQQITKSDGNQLAENGADCRATDPPGEQDQADDDEPSAAIGAPAADRGQGRPARRPSAQTGELAASSVDEQAGRQCLPHRPTVLAWRAPTPART